MNKLSSLGLAILMAFTVTGCELYFGPEDGPSAGGEGQCLSDGYYVNGELVSAQCPGGGDECASNDDCAAGCYCVVPDGATAGGKCEEAGFCNEDLDCATGYECDARSSCVPDENPATCAGVVDASCTNGAPKCAAGQVPLIQDGCWADVNNDGRDDCQAIAQCQAPPTCAAYQFAADCDNANGCTVVTRGTNCTMSNGSACVDGVPGCVCAMYVYDSCR